LASVLILKLIEEPTLTLMSEENPWIVGSPDPEMSHTEGSVPGLLFSQTIGFEPVPHGVAAWTVDGAAATSAAEHIRTSVVTIEVTDRGRRR
jgi:hypothetical protein